MLPTVWELKQHFRSDAGERHTSDKPPELAAALIALRQVFVPVDISGLTRLDVQLLVLCWLMAVTLRAGPRTRSAPASCQRSATRDVLLVRTVWLGVLLRQRRRLTFALATRGSARLTLDAGRGEVDGGRRPAVELFATSRT